MNALQKELAKLLQKRDQIRDKQVQRYRDGSATRARTTTYNAEVDRINERIIWLREEIKEQGT